MGHHLEDKEKAETEEPDYSSGGSDSESEDVGKSQEQTEKEKRRKPGIIYLSSVPEGMTVAHATRYFSDFGRVGRIFLQPDPKHGHRLYTEGWVEFMSKRMAKRVAQQLNRTPVGGKRRSKGYGSLWNIKYLPRFKWIHLRERLAYEHAVKQQRLRTEISQVKRETEHFKSSVSGEKKRKKKSKAEKSEDMEASASRAEDDTEFPLFYFAQKETDSAIRKRKLDQDGSQEEDDPPHKRKKSKKSKESKSKKLMKESIQESSSGATRSGSRTKPDSKSSKPKKSKLEDKHTTSIPYPVIAEPPSRGGRKSTDSSSPSSAGSSRRRSAEKTAPDRAAILRSVFGGAPS